MTDLHFNNSRGCMTHRKLKKIYFLTFSSSHYLPPFLSLSLESIILRANQFLVNIDSNKLRLGKLILQHKTQGERLKYGQNVKKAERFTETETMRILSKI